MASAGLPAGSQDMTDDPAHGATDGPPTSRAGEWLLPHLGGVCFTALVFGDVDKAKSLAAAFGAGTAAPSACDGASGDRASYRGASASPAAGTPKAGPIAMQVVAVLAPDATVSADAIPSSVIALRDVEGLAARRYDARPGTVYLLRPDQHVCARFRDASPADLRAASARALGYPPPVAALAAASRTEQVETA
jgi:hypothetical protein